MGHTHTIRIRGWKAVVGAVVLAAAWVGWRIHVSSTLDKEAVDALKPWIQAECARAVLKEAEQKPLTSMSKAEAEDFARRLVASHDVAIKVTGMHGTDGTYVIQADVAVDGKALPGRGNPRYYKMKYSVLTGWTYDHESDAVGYWLNLL